MSPRLTAATAGRVLQQMRHDPRTLVLLIGVPTLLIGLMAWMFDGTDTLDRMGPVLVGTFPLILMFLVTSVATLRERQSGTLERLMTLPVGKADFVLGYALAFALLALVQAIVVVGFALLVGMDVKGPLAALFVLAVLDAALGSALGLGASALARTEFQAVQMMPAIIFPQLIIGGILMPRDQMPEALEWISRAFPLTYAVDTMQRIARGEGWAELAGGITVIVCFIIGALTLGAATLRRRTV